MKNDKYASVACNDCASSHGGSMPNGHVASFHEGICEGCGHWKIITSVRDFRYPSIKKFLMTEETRHRIIEELKGVKVKYQCQGNASAVDEIDRQISDYLE